MKNKYTYYKVIQEHYGFGWNDVDFHECASNGVLYDRKSFKENVKAYNENMPCAHRIIFRKELNAV